MKAVIFDCFGVLTSDGWLPFKSKQFAHDPELMQEASDLSKQSDAGMISFRDFLQGIAELAEVSVEETRRAIESNVPDEALLDYIAQLKPTYNIGFLSNASANHLNDLFTDKQIALFDALAISFDTGFVKPDHRAFTDIAQRLGLEPEDCIFVDDMQRNCAAAQEVGMQAVWHQNTPQTIAALNKLLTHPED